MNKPFNKLNFSLPFSMETAVPVDYNSFFTSYNEASAAASTAVTAGSNESIYYVGQQLYVVDDAEKTVKTYLISHDKTLTDIGKNYTFTGGLSSEYLSSSDKWNVGIDTTKLEQKFSNYLPLSGGKLTGDLQRGDVTIETGDISIYDEDEDEELWIDYNSLNHVINKTDVKSIKIPHKSGTLALTSLYLSGYGITDAYTKSETMSSIDGNGRFAIVDVTPFIEIGAIPLKPYSAETLSADGSDLTFAFIGLNTFDTTHRYYKGESVWHNGSPYKCSVESIGIWDSSKFERIYRELLVDIDCTGIDDTGFEITWPSTIDVFGGSTSADMSPVSGEHNVYRITEYRDGYFSIDKIGGDGTSDKISELSLLVAKNAENNASNTLQNVTNYNLIMELYRQRQ